MPDRQDHRQDREHVGSVAEEAARLLDALGGWAQSATSDGHRHQTPGGGTDRAASDSHARRESPATAASRCEHCGADSRMGEAISCRLCPVCQGISLLRSVRPETVDRLADLAAALSSTLRDLAAEHPGRPRERPAPGRHSDRVQEIRVEDEDAGTPGSTTR